MLGLLAAISFPALAVAFVILTVVVIYKMAEEITGEKSDLDPRLWIIRYARHIKEREARREEQAKQEAEIAYSERQRLHEEAQRKSFQLENRLAREQILATKKRRLDYIRYQKDAMFDWEQEFSFRTGQISQEEYLNCRNAKAFLLAAAEEAKAAERTVSGKNTRELARHLYNEGYIDGDTFNTVGRVYQDKGVNHEELDRQTQQLKEFISKAPAMPTGAAPPMPSYIDLEVERNRIFERLGGFTNDTERLKQNNFRKETNEILNKHYDGKLSLEAARRQMDNIVRKYGYRF